MQEKFKKLQQSLDNDALFIIEKLAYIIDFVRPSDVKELSKTLDAMALVREFFTHKTESL